MELLLNDFFEEQEIIIALFDNFYVDKDLKNLKVDEEECKENYLLLFPDNKEKAEDICWDDLANNFNGFTSWVSATVEEMAEYYEQGEL